MKVLIVFGTRPEAIKMAPLVLELKKRIFFDVKVCVTGQHKEMLYQVLEKFDIEPDFDLDIMKQNQTLFDVTSAILSKMGSVLEAFKPDLVLVHGDTSTTFTTALAAFYKNIPIGHVEAGLRTYDLQSPYPEEFNRQAVSIIAKYHFSPTEASRDNLIREGKEARNIYVTGNTAIDVLKFTIRDDFKDNNFDWIGKSRLILLTAHRRENLGDPMRQMFKAIKKIIDEYEDVKAIYPIHMNPVVRNVAHEIFGNDSKIKLIEPLDVVEFHNYMKRSYLILTDSGGIQEEAPSLKKPVLVMRETTERPEGVKAGTLKLVGVDEENIYNQIKILLDNEDEYLKMARSKNPYGDGIASERIADILEFGYTPKKIHGE